MTTDGDYEKEVSTRITKANQAFAICTLHKIWKSKNIGLKTKLRIFKSNILSVLL